MGFEFSPRRQRKTGVKWSLPSCSVVISGSHIAFLMWRSFHFDLDGTGGWQRDGPTTRKDTESTEPELKATEPEGAQRTGALGTQPRALFSHVNPLPSLSHRTEDEFTTIGPSHTETQRKEQDISATSTNLPRPFPESLLTTITSANRPLPSLFTCKRMFSTWHSWDHDGHNLYFAFFPKYTLGVSMWCLCQRAFFS